MVQLEHDMGRWDGVGVGSGRVHSLSLIGSSPHPCPLRVIGGELGLLSELERLNLSNNQLQGQLPIKEGLAGLRLLRQLTLSKNCLSGPLTHVSLLRHLADLDLSHNQLSGLLPPDLPLHLPELVTLNLSHNQLVGKLPTELKHLSALRVLNLGHNSFVGWLESWVGGLTNLQRLDLSHNRLEGQFPSALKRLSALEYLHLNNNNVRREVEKGEREEFASPDLFDVLSAVCKCVVIFSLVCLYFH